MQNQDKTNDKIIDVAIIGAGPVGLFAVFQCGMLGLKTAVIDALPEIGGQCTALYPEKPIYDIPGFPSVLAGELIDNLEKQAAPFKPDYHLGQQVLRIEKKGKDASELWHIETSSGTEITAKAIMIAAGAGAFGPNKPPLEGIEQFENKSVFYMVKDRSKFADKNIVIAGGGDSAVDWANSLSDIARKVYVVHRRDKFRAAPENIRQMKEKENIEMIVPAQLKALDGDAVSGLKAVIVHDMDDQERRLEADMLLPFFGLASSLGPIAEWGLSIRDNMIETDPATSMTNVGGIYAVGDIAHYPNKLKLILTGFSEVSMAAHHIWGVLHPDQHLHQEYSTTKGVPGGQ